MVRRGRLYLDAGADCIYPLRLTDPALAAKLVAELGAPINANAGSPPAIAEMAQAGVSRLSIGPTAHNQVMADLRTRAAELLGPDSP